MQNAWNGPYGRQPSYYPLNSIVGRFINNINEVQPNEIPMNGSICFYPMYDGSAIYARRWNNDGTLSTDIYICQQSHMPDMSADPPKQEEDPIEVIMHRLDDIEKKLNKPYYKKGNNYGQQNNQSTVSQGDE